MFKINEKGNLKYLTLEEFSKTGCVKHCFSTKFGGVSSGVYESMNLRFNCSDKRENVLKNFEILCSAEDIDYKSLVLTKQVHEDIIIPVNKDFSGNGITFENRFSSADGLICAEAGVPITVFGADCLPIMFLDPVKRVIATAHSGWRGTVLKIAQKCAIKMMAEYGCKKEDIIVSIFPSIRACCYEVSDEVAEIFLREFGESVLEKHGDRCHINLQQAVKNSLFDIGVLNVLDSEVCTFCNSDMFFSHRKTGDARGVMAGVIELI